MRFLIPVEPYPQRRPRIFKTKTGKYLTIYPGAGAKQRLMIREFVLKNGGKKFPKPTPLRLEVKFVLKKPTSARRKYPSVRPDLDNYVKLLKDALSGYLWDDDGQIVELIAKKEYGEMPCIELEVEQVA